MLEEPRYSKKKLRKTRKRRFNATQTQQKYNFKYIFGKLLKIQLIFSRQTTTSLVRLRLQRNTVIAFEKSHFGSSSAWE